MLCQKTHLNKTSVTLTLHNKPECHGFDSQWCCWNFLFS